MYIELFNNVLEIVVYFEKKMYLCSSHKKIIINN